jgi:hypothetical protein
LCVVAGCANLACSFVPAARVVGQQVGRQQAGGRAPKLRETQVGIS